MIKPRGKTVASCLIGVALVLTLLSGSAAAAAKRAAKGPAAKATPAAALENVRVLGGRQAPFALDARAAMLVEAHTGVVLYSYNEHERVQPASLAKLMTFYLALEALEAHRITPETQVTISTAAWRLSMNQTVSRMFLEPGQKVSVNDLLYGMMVSSGNDAALALAEYLGGSAEAFVAQMNKKGQELGLSETHFENPDGLPTEGQYTTASDMTKLGRAIVRRFPNAITYTSTKEFTFHQIHQRNFNTLLFYDSRVKGLKTGHVEEAGFHLVASAASNGAELVSAVMGTPSSEKRRTETEKLLDWAFRTFTVVQPNWRKAAPERIRVYEGAAPEVAVAPLSPPLVTVYRGDERKVSLGGTLKVQYLVAPVAKGAEVGELALMVGGKPETSIPLVTQDAVAPGGLTRRLFDRLRLRF